MRAVVVRGPGEYGVEQVPEPRFGDYEALVRISHCGICSGTDRHIIEGPSRFPYMSPYPTILGHESIGTIVAKGARARYLSEGDTILRAMTGKVGEFSSTFGGMAEYGIVTDARAIIEDAPKSEAPLPHPMRYQQTVPASFDRAGVGTFITFKETLSAAQDFGVSEGARVAVLGVGGVGLCFVRACKLLGAEQVIAVGRRAAPLERALNMGADAVVNSREVDLAAEVRRLTDGLACTHVIDAVGDNDLLQQGLALLANGGRIGQYGVPATRRYTLDWGGAPGVASLHYIAPTEHRVHKQALDAVRLGFFDPMSMVDAVVPMSDVHEAFRLLESQEAIRVTLQIA